MNQILISQKIYVTKEMRRKRIIYKTLYLLSIISIIALLLYYVLAEKDRNEQEALSQEILDSFVAHEDQTTVEETSIVFALNENNEDESQEIQQIEIIEENHNTPAPSQVSTSNGQTYSTEARLKFPKLNIDYPILSEESEALLKVSLCKYWGPTPNEVGNYCIVGHNYKSGKMFGKLSMAEVGDQVTLTGLDGKTVTYQIYNIYVVEPTDVSCTSQLTNGKRELTLITCTNYGKQRLVVRAREV